MRHSIGMNELESPAPDRQPKFKIETFRDGQEAQYLPRREGVYPLPLISSTIKSRRITDLGRLAPAVRALVGLSQAARHG